MRLVSLRFSSTGYEPRVKRQQSFQLHLQKHRHPLSPLLLPTLRRASEMADLGKSLGKITPLAGIDDYPLWVRKTLNRLTLVGLQSHVGTTSRSAEGVRFDETVLELYCYCCNRQSEPPRDRLGGSTCYPGLQKISRLLSLLPPEIVAWE